jgi:hypothetical protein
MAWRSKVIVSLLVVLFHAAPASATAITTIPASGLPGDELMIDVRISDVTDLVSFDFNVAFDSSVLSFVGATEGSFLNSGNPDNITFFFFCPNDDPGLCAPEPPVSVSNILFSPAEGTNGEGVLATLIFSVIGTGSANLQLEQIRLFNSALDAIAVDDVNFGDVNVVPEPSTLGLLGIGLAVLGRRRLKHRLRSR